LPCPEDNSGSSSGKKDAQLKLPVHILGFWIISVMDFAERLSSIKKRMEAACERAGRNPTEVALMGATKGQSPDSVKEAAGLGLTLFGENKIQEGKAKVSLCPGRLHWHMIGHLQTNKCRDAVHFFEMIQSVDSLHLAEEINTRAAQGGKTMPILLEVNVAGESSKFGYRPEVLLAELEKLNALRRIEIQGLMAIPPWAPDSEKVRPIFRQVRELKQQCEEILGAPLPHLSMGMSGDFEIAIEEGASIVRIGTALFGPRGVAKGRT
jgi:pyridoxal phosphate enzyme (YggS family)